SSCVRSPPARHPHPLSLHDALPICTCSLEPEEGEALVAQVLADEPRLRRRPIAPGEVAGLDGLINSDGDLRTLPCHWPDADSRIDRKSTRLNSSHVAISYAVFCLKK